MPRTRTISGEKDHIKRPDNAWILFRKEYIKKIPLPPPGEPQLPQAVISGILSKMWREAPPEVRREFQEKSRLAHAEHRAKYPHYKFRPVKKEEKMRIKKEKEEEKKAQRQQTRGNASRTRRNDHRGPPPPLLTTTPLPGAAPPIPSMGHASSLPPRDTIVAPPVVPSQNHFSAEPIQPAGRASTTVQTPSTQYSTPSASPSAMLPMLRLSPPHPAFDTQMVFPQPGMPQYTPPSASTWQQPSPPYSQPQQEQADYGVDPTTLHSQSSSLDFSAYEVPAQQADSGASLATLLSQTSSLDFSEYEVPTQHLTIPVPAQLLPDPTEWDSSSMDSLLSYQPINEHPSDDPLCFVFGTGDSFGNEQIFDDPRGIKVDNVAMDPNSFGYLSSLGSTGSFNGSMGDTALRSEIQDFADLFDSLIQDDENVAGPSRPVGATSAGNDSTPQLSGIISSILNSMDQADAASGVQAGSSYLASEVQPEVTQPVVNTYTPTYVPPAGATQSSTRRVGAYWGHRQASAESDVAMS